MAIDDNREKQDKVYVSFVKLILRERKNIWIYHKKVILAMKEREKMAPNNIKQVKKKKTKIELIEMTS